MSALNGVSVLVAGAGLAGLSAARDLTALGATVTVVEARDRVGGRAWTIREGFKDGQHAEGGADLIDGAQEEIQKLAAELGLELTRILRSGWGSCPPPDGHGRPQIVRRGVARGWERLAKQVSAFSEPYRSRNGDGNRQSWRTSRASRWPTGCGSIDADDELRQTALGLPASSSAIPTSSRCSRSSTSSPPRTRRFPTRCIASTGGNDRLATALSAPLRQALKLRTEVVAVSQRGQRGPGQSQEQPPGGTAVVRVCRVRASRPRSCGASRSRRRCRSSSTTRLSRLKYGRATKTLLQFSRRFWRIPAGRRAFRSPLPFGAVWGRRRRTARAPGILNFMSGGSASDATRELFTREGPEALARTLDWLGGKRADLIASRQVAWDDDPWARGGYAFFDPAFDPALRSWLARRPVGCSSRANTRATSGEGYMNGAIEGSRRAAAKSRPFHALTPA